MHSWHIRDVDLQLPLAIAALTAGARALPSGIMHAICDGWSKGVKLA